MIKVVVSGACGKMGKTLIANLVEQPDMKLAGALEKDGHPSLGVDVGEVLHMDPAGIKLSSNGEEVIKNGDVLVEFSSPAASVGHFRIVAKNKKSAVIGTTGFSADQLNEIRKLAGEIPCVVSPNMSVGINLLFVLARKVAPILKDYDIEIVEAHHRMKKDAPSGTALKFAKVIAESLGRDLDKDGVYGRKGHTGERKSGEIGIHAVRGGDIAGEHTIIFAGKGERVELVHRASSRDAFALGALKAVRFAAAAKPGLYDMEAVLGLK